MKKLLLIIVCIISMTINAQENRHLKFKDIPINGQLDSFVSKLKSKGYTFVYESDDHRGVVLKGKFVDEDAQLLVLGSSKTNTVWKVAVYVDKGASWYTLKNHYYEYVKLYSEKYGKPSDNFEFFSDPYYEGDGFELQALKAEKCIYISYFETPLGMITVGISSSGEIEFVYEDKINSDIWEKEKKQTSRDDI